MLLLTRAKALDVLVGKLGSAGIVSLCGLVAFLPVLMIPILAGGVTGGEVARKALALLATLFLALAVGLWTAAGKPARGRLALRAIRTVVLWVFVPFLCSRIDALPSRCVGMLSPLIATLSAGDMTYQLDCWWYWGSLVSVSAAGWALLTGAGFRLRRVGCEPSGPSVATLSVAEDAQAPFSLRSWYVGRLVAEPIEWLVLRQRGVRPALWTASLLGLIYHAAAMPAYYSGGFLLFPLVTVWPTLTTALLVGTLLAWAASRFTNPSATQR